MLIACGLGPGNPTPRPPESAKDCERYQAPGLVAHCVTHLVARGRLPVTACEALPPPASDCRSAAVENALSQGRGTREELLTACGSVADCALQVLDTRPLRDPIAQLQACRAHAGPYAADCTLHALQRWVAIQPDSTAFDAVASETQHPEVVGALLGLVVACQGVGDCERVSPEAAPACHRAVQEDVPARPEICQLSGVGNPR